MSQASRRRFVIVGGGLAAAETVRTLRSEGFDVEIVLVAAEARLPYERPPLTKEYLRGEATADTLLAQPPDLYGRERIELLLGRTATELDAQRRRLTLDDGAELTFDALLLATGARPRGLPDAGTLPSWAHVVRTIEDADRLRASAASAASALVVGGGWIAAEAAASLRQLGLEVTLAVPGREPLERALGPEVAARYGRLHREHGVAIVGGARAAGLVDEPTRRGVRLTGDHVLAADLVVLGLGAIPNVELARDAGLAVDNGVLVDAALAAAAPGIFAAGDVASAWHPRYAERVRSEHWDNARKQGRAAARSMLGRGESYDRLPYFYSDQFDLGMELIGRPTLGETVAVRDEPAGGFVALWLRAGRVVAGLHGNVWDAKAVIDRLVTAEAPVDVARLRDPRVPLVDLAPELAA